TWSRRLGKALEKRLELRASMAAAPHRRRRTPRVSANGGAGVAVAIAWGLSTDRHLTGRKSEMPLMFLESAGRAATGSLGI
uniref:Uncharacterized protein n=1 Tax=Aegilops tauschii subsp. strangulata TaxID=200361 RepID=A0A452ZNE6_AEGTS